MKSRPRSRIEGVWWEAGGEGRKEQYEIIGYVIHTSFCRDGFTDGEEPGGGGGR